MAVLRPVSTVSSVLWETNTGNPVDLHPSIDEAILDTTDFILCLGATLAGDPDAPCTIRLAAGVDPGVNTGNEMRCWVRGHAGHTIVWELLAFGSLIRQEFFDAAGGPLEMVFVLTSGEVDQIRGQGGYGQLDFRWTRIADGSAWVPEVYQAEFRLPDVGFVHLVPAATGYVVAAANSGTYVMPDGPGLRLHTGTEVDGAGIDFLAGHLRVKSP